MDELHLLLKTIELMATEADMKERFRLAMKAMEYLKVHTGNDKEFLEETRVKFKKLTEQVERVLENVA